MQSIIPSATDTIPLRRRASTPPSYRSSESSSTYSDHKQSDGWWGFHSHIVVPSHHRLVSRLAVNRRAGPSLANGSGHEVTAVATPIFSLSPQSSPSLSVEERDVAEVQILEPIDASPIERVQSFGQVLDNTYAGDDIRRGSVAVDFAMLDVSAQRHRPSLTSVIPSGLQVPWTDSEAFLRNPTHFFHVPDSLPYQHERRSWSRSSGSSECDVYLDRQDTFTQSGLPPRHFVGHYDTFALSGLPPRIHTRTKSSFHSTDTYPGAGDLRLAPTLPAAFFACIVPFLPFSTYLALRLTCRSWSRGITAVRPIQFRPIHRLPSEVLHMIFKLLPPYDFDAARHTCRAWMMASLDVKLLKSQLLSGGWLQVAMQDLDRNEGRIGGFSDAWLLSKRLAAECALGPGWWENGLRLGRMDVGRGKP